MTFVKLLSYDGDDIYLKLDQIVGIEIKKGLNAINVYIELASYDNCYLVQRNQEAERLLMWIEKHTRSIDYIMKLEDIEGKKLS